MPFDPRIISSDNASFEGVAELELPDDLMQLADQLRDDAAFLANRYTPESFGERDPVAAPVHRATSTASKPKRQRFGLLVLLSSLATVLVLLAMIPKAIDSSKKDAVDRSVASTENAVPTNVAHRPDPANVEKDVVREDLVRNTSKETKSTNVPFNTVPVMLLHGASGPEQEAILDLIQQDNDQEMVLSI